MPTKRRQTNKQNNDKTPTKHRQNVHPKFTTKCRQNADIQMKQKSHIFFSSHNKKKSIKKTFLKMKKQTHMKVPYFLAFNEYQILMVENNHMPCRFTCHRTPNVIFILLVLATYSFLCLNSYGLQSRNTFELQQKSKKSALYKNCFTHGCRLNYYLFILIMHI